MENQLTRHSSSKIHLTDKNVPFDIRHHNTTQHNEVVYILQKCKQILTNRIQDLTPARTPPVIIFQEFISYIS